MLFEALLAARLQNVPQNVLVSFFLVKNIAGGGILAGEKIELKVGGIYSTGKGLLS
jgi:hypothetical protein